MELQILLPNASQEKHMKQEVSQLIDTLRARRKRILSITLRLARRGGHLKTRRALYNQSEWLLQQIIELHDERRPTRQIVYRPRAKREET